MVLPTSTRDALGFDDEFRRQAAAFVPEQRVDPSAAPCVPLRTWATMTPTIAFRPFASDHYNRTGPAGQTAETPVSAGCSAGSPWKATNRSDGTAANALLHPSFRELRAGGSSFHWDSSSVLARVIKFVSVAYTSIAFGKAALFASALSPSLCAVRLAGTGVDLYLASTLVAGFLPTAATARLRTLSAWPIVVLFVVVSTLWAMSAHAFLLFPPSSPRASNEVARRGGGCWCRGLKPFALPSRVCRRLFHWDSLPSVPPVWAVNPLPPRQMRFQIAAGESRGWFHGWPCGEPVSSHRTFPSALVQHPFNSGYIANSKSQSQRSSLISALSWLLVSFSVCPAGCPQHDNLIGSFV